MSTHPAPPHRTGLFFIRQGTGGSRITPAYVRIAKERAFDNRVADLIADGKSFKATAHALEVGVPKIKASWHRICTGLGERP